MARFRRSRRRGGSGMNGMIKAAAIGAIAGAFAPRVPVLNTLPTFVTGAGAAYMLGGKSMRNAVIGGASAQFLSPMLAGAINTVRATAGSEWSS